MSDSGTNILVGRGNTPMIKIGNLTQGEILAKDEFLNPGGSIKDRIAAHIIGQAEKRGDLRPGSMIIEATSGNTGIGMVLVGRQRGYRVIIIMPENMSEERKKILRAYGAELLLTPAVEGMPGAVKRALSMAETDSRYYLVKQFENPANAECHEVTTAREILQQMGKNLDALVCGVGSGGTITGIARVLKQEIPAIKIVAVEPANSAVLSGNPAGSHKIQGIGAGFIPRVLNLELVDNIIAVTDKDAIETCRQLARQEALLLGISSGAAIFAALQLADKMGKGKKILAIAPDSADKYISTELFD